MTDDLLKLASRALREETERDDQAARFTRSRILATAHSRKRKRSTKMAFLIPLAAILVGSTAWAAVSGELPRVLSRMAQVVGVLPKPPEETAPPPTKPPKRLAPVPAPRAPSTEPEISPSASAAPSAEAPAAPVVSAVSVLSPPARALASAPPRAASSSSEPAPPAEALAGAAAPSGSSAEDDPAEGLYRLAHRAHFEEHNSAAALNAWDRYLAAAPRGRFALEATYNRALCLVRLGRRSEAIRALAPFASGRFGSYRQREAAELSQALQSDENDGGLRPGREL